MPLIQFHHPPGVFSKEDKQAISAGLTTTVYRRLPPFYVNVHFIALDPENHYIAGVPRDNMVRIVMEHIARHTVPDSVDTKEATVLKDRIDSVIKPYIADRGFDWEFAVRFGEQHIWRINGIDPPIIGEDEAIEAWTKAGKAIPRD